MSSFRFYLVRPSIEAKVEKSTTTTKGKKVVSMSVAAYIYKKQTKHKDVNNIH